MSLKLTPEAERDLIEAVEWLRQRSPTLPGRFGATLDRTIRMINEHPESYPVVHHRFRRALLKTFPWAVFFTVERDTVIVHAIVHHARHPSVWKQSP